MGAIPHAVLAIPRRHLLEVISAIEKEPAPSKQQYKQNNYQQCASIHEASIGLPNRSAMGCSTYSRGILDKG